MGAKIAGRILISIGPHIGGTQRAVGKALHQPGTTGAAQQQPVALPRLGHTQGRQRLEHQQQHATPRPDPLGDPIKHAAYLQSDVAAVNGIIPPTPL